jgi:hypothetical protein
MLLHYVDSFLIRRLVSVSTDIRFAKKISIVEIINAFDIGSAPPERAD